ncbi:MAG: hypothetical protein WBF61_03910 [Carnobacterium sp.]
MRTKKQVIGTIVLIVIAIILKSTIGFAQVVDNLVMLFFVLLGCWFTYDNAKRKDRA